MPQVTRLEHVNLNAQDPMRLATFYCDLLGMRVFAQIPENQAVFLAAPARQESFDLSIFHTPAGAADRAQPVSPGERTASSPHIAFLVPTLADLRKCPQEASRLGGTYLFALNHGPAISCHILDPEGTQIELAWPTGRQSRRLMAIPIDLALSEEELLRIVDASTA
jgi:catechol-2,3-dioxygenase